MKKLILINGTMGVGKSGNSSPQKTAEQIIKIVQSK